MLDDKDDLGKEFARSPLSNPLVQGVYEDAQRRMRWNATALVVLLSAMGAWVPLFGAIVGDRPVLLPAIGTLLTLLALYLGIVGWRKKKWRYTLGANVLAATWVVPLLALRALW
ncbi:hypothetical protein ACWGJ2_08410 [Streptomyces sp. NPDC054796]